MAKLIMKTNKNNYEVVIARKINSIDDNLIEEGVNYTVLIDEDLEIAYYFQMNANSKILAEKFAKQECIKNFFIYDEDN